MFENEKVLGKSIYHTNVFVKSGREGHFRARILSALGMMCPNFYYSLVETNKLNTLVEKKKFKTLFKLHL